MTTKLKEEKWRCEKCFRWISVNEGTDNERPNWCDSCWTIERLQAELAETQGALQAARDIIAIFHAEYGHLGQHMNPIEQYIVIQIYDSEIWLGVSQRFELTENQQAFSELGKWRERFPDSKFRLVSRSRTHEI